MLFEFNKFWKSLLIIGACWLTYAIFGYEFTSITILAALLAKSITNKTFLV
jgi:hypothetical protein